MATNEIIFAIVYLGGLVLQANWLYSFNHRRRPDQHWIKRLGDSISVAVIWPLLFVVVAFMGYASITRDADLYGTDFDEEDDDEEDEIDDEDYNDATDPDEDVYDVYEDDLNSCLGHMANGYRSQCQECRDVNWPDENLTACEFHKQFAIGSGFVDHCNDCLELNPKWCEFFDIYPTKKETK
jgi:hypothetical protein